MSAPPTVTTFASPSAPGSKGAQVDDVHATTASPAKKARSRRESAQTPSTTTPRSSRQRAVTATGATPGTETAVPAVDGSGHKRKPSQNTLWQNSRAILGGSGGGSIAGAGSPSAAVVPASPVKPSVLNSVPAATPSPSRRQSAPVTNPAFTVTGGQVQHPQAQHMRTPRRASAMVAGAAQAAYPGGVPQSAPAHITQYTNYAPYHPSNLNPSPIHPSLLQQQGQSGHAIAVMSPAAAGQPMFAASPYGPYTLATPQQQQQIFMQHPHTIAGPAGQPIYHQTPMQDPHMQAQAAQYMQMTAPHGSSASMYTLHHPQSQPGFAYSPPIAHQMSAAGQVSQAGSPVSNAGSFVAPHAPQQQQQQDGMPVVGRNRSRSGLSRTPSDMSTFAPTLEHASASQQGMGGPSSSQDSSSLDTNLSLSQPVPRARTTTAPANLQMLGHSTGSTEDASASAAELMLFLAHSPSPKAASRKVNVNGQSAIGTDLKGRRLFAGNSQEDLSSQSMEQNFSAQQAQYLQSAPGEEMYAPPSADEMAQFAASHHLQGPFEYTQYAMVGGGQPVEIGQEYTNAW